MNNSLLEQSFGKGKVLRHRACSKPANMIEDSLSHPFIKDSMIELSVSNEHRFAFYSWAKWKINKTTSSDLISFDWHQDLLPPNEREREELDNLNIVSLEEISIFSWARLNPLNDSHILSAAYLNLISNIWVVCRKQFDKSESELIDFKGNVHKIYLFNDVNELFKGIRHQDIKEILFDIDLDYFTIENSSSNDQEFYSYIDDNEFNKIFSIESELIKWIFCRITGLTIAIEPTFTGGITKSIEFLRKLERLWFTDPIGNRKCTWTEFIKKQLGG